MGRFSTQKVTHKRVQDLRGWKCKSSLIKYDKWWNKECVCVYTHTHKGGRSKKDLMSVREGGAKKWELFFSLFTWQPPVALEKLHLLVCCVDLHCACIHTWWPPWHLDWRLNKVDTLYTTSLPVYLWISSSENPPKKKRLRRKRQWKSGKNQKKNKK